MAQYDVILIQNTHPTLVEYSEKYVNLSKGSLLTVDSSRIPTSVAVGSDGQVLIADAASAGGFKWVAQSTVVAANSHTQNTDTGTTQTKFVINAGGFALEETAESASKWGIKVSGGATYADLQAKDATFNTVSVSSAPTLAAHLTNKTYVDGLLASNDAMVFKGTVGTAGTLTGATFSALTNYNAGDTYKVITAASYTTKDGTVIVAEIGDMLIATVDRVGASWTAGDWIAVQTNIDGAVVGPVSAGDGAVALFNGATGKIIKNSGCTIISTLDSSVNIPNSGAVKAVTDTLIPKSAYTAADVLLIGSGAGTYSTLTPGASTIIGKKASGGVVALSKTDLLTILNVADGANVAPVVATGAEVDTGTDNAKYVSAKTVADSRLVSGPSSSITDRIATFSNTTGKLIKDSGKALSDLMLTWVAAPATKTSAGSAGQMSYDSNYLYVCQATNVWKRSILATNW